MSSLTVTLIQAAPHWHDADANRRLFAQRIDSLDDATDLIVLPEMFTTGFSMDAATQAETMDGASMEWLARKASASDASVCGSLIIEDGGEYFNRFVVMNPDGSFTSYDKRHLFRLADEDQYYSPGTDLVTFELGGFRIRPLICYDLRFPVWSRNKDAYDLLVFVANWPSRRHLAWQTLIRARAIENLAYVAAVNRCGTDGNDLPYLGGSAVLDYLGQDLVDLGEQEGIATATLDMNSLLEFRERFAFHKDADDFTID